MVPVPQSNDQRALFIHTQRTLYKVCNQVHLTRAFPRSCSLVAVFGNVSHSAVETTSSGTD
jgi:hypothetical protein